MASVSEVKTAISTALSGVTGLKRVYTTAPNSLPPSDLPAVVIYAGAATYTEDGYDLTGETRRYTLRLHVLPLQQGIPGEAEAACEPFFARVRAAFPPGARLGRLTGVLEARVTGDTGVSVLTLGGSSYLGVEFTLEVQQ